MSYLRKVNNHQSTERKGRSPPSVLLLEENQGGSSFGSLFSDVGIYCILWLSFFGKPSYKLKLSPTILTSWTED